MSTKKHALHVMQGFVCHKQVRKQDLEAGGTEIPFAVVIQGLVWGINATAAMILTRILIYRPISWHFILQQCRSNEPIPTKILLNI